MSLEEIDRDSSAAAFHFRAAKKLAGDTGQQSDTEGKRLARLVADLRKSQQGLSGLAENTATMTNTQRLLLSNLRAGHHALGLVLGHISEAGRPAPSQLTEALPVSAELAGDPSIPENMRSALERHATAYQQKVPELTTKLDELLNTANEMFGHLVEMNKIHADAAGKTGYVAEKVGDFRTASNFDYGPYHPNIL